MQNVAGTLKKHLTLKVRTSLTRLTEEVGNLFEGNNPDYKLPNFVSSGIKYAKESFNSLVKVGNDAVTEVKRKAGSSINSILGK